MLCRKAASASGRAAGPWRNTAASIPTAIPSTSRRTRATKSTSTAGCTAEQSHAVTCPAGEFGLADICRKSSAKFLLECRKQSTLGEFPMHHLMRRPTGGRWIRLAILFLLLLPTRHDTGDRLHAPHIERGRQVAQRYEAHGRRLAEYYASLAAAARQSAPDLLAYLQPRSPLLTGYQVLPPILRAAPERRSAPASAAYSWPWTDRLIDGALREIERAEADLAGAKADPRRSRAILQRLALDYSRLSAQRANIDAH